MSSCLIPALLCLAFFAGLLWLANKALTILDDDDDEHDDPQQPITP